MVPTKTTPKPLFSSSNIHNQIQQQDTLSPTQFPLLPPLMTGPNPYPLSPQPHPNSPLPSHSPLPPPSDSNFHFPQFPLADSTIHPSPITRDHTQIAALPHWVDQPMDFDFFGTEIGVSDLDIDKIIAHFFDDPNTEFNAPEPGLGLAPHPSVSVDLNGSECKGDERGKGVLKRGIDIANPQHNAVDNLGSALYVDNIGIAKRSRKTGIEEDNGNEEFGFEFQWHALTGSSVHIDGSEFVGSISAVESDRRGKRKLVGGSSSEKVDDNGGDGIRRFSREEKRKEVVIDVDLLPDVIDEAELGLETKTKSSADNVALLHQLRQTSTRREDGSRKKMERFRDIAKENASRFARFSPDVEDDRSSPVPEVEHEIDGLPTPFSTAMKMIKDRGMKSAQTGRVFSERNLPASITWVSKRNHEHNIGARISVPSLLELSLKVLADNADAIVSLDSVPDDLRHRLSQLLCDSRKMNSHFFELLVSGSPTEIQIRDCSWLTEEQFTKSFQTCDTADLVVLQLDQCGRCITDYALLATLAQSPRLLPKLTSLSLSGACRLSDRGLRALISSAPVLRSINLSQCSLLTSASLNILADSLGSLLKELYLDDCQNIDAALIVPALKELEHLEVLSLAGIQTVCDEFIKDYISACGHKMKELVLKDCIKLTDASIKVIAQHCPGLCVLDLMNLCKLTDLSIGYLANSCQALHTLKLCRNPFSDEAIAAFLETTGESMKELSLNNIKKIGHHTTLSLASRAKNLHTLDLSWCRNLTDNELGLIVDSCFSLRLLKLFGCTQVTDVFLKGHSNPEIQIIGLKLSSLLQDVKVPDPHKGALRYSPVSVNLI